jgi:hypothetical protein
VFSLLFEAHPKRSNGTTTWATLGCCAPSGSQPPKPDNRRRLTPVPAASEPPMPNHEVPQRRISLLVRFSFKANACIKNLD